MNTNYHYHYHMLCHYSSTKLEHCPQGLYVRLLILVWPKVEGDAPPLSFRAIGLARDFPFLLTFLPDSLLCYCYYSRFCFYLSFNGAMCVFSWCNPYQSRFANTNKKEWTKSNAIERFPRHFWKYFDIFATELVENIVVIVLVPLCLWWLSLHSQSHVRLLLSPHTL